MPNFASTYLKKAPVAELVDAPDLGSGVSRRAGSSPVRRTMKSCQKYFQATIE